MAEIQLNSCCGGIFFFGFGLLLIYGAVQRYMLAQKIRNTPTSKVRSAAVGLAELFGKASCRADMQSPVSKAKCAYYRLTGEYYYQTRKSSGWKQFFRRESSQQFFLEDDTGKMLVEPAGAEIDIPSDFQCTGHLSEGGILGMFKATLLDKKVMDFLASDDAAKNSFNQYSSRNLRVTEYYIADGDPLYVLGTATPLSGSSSAVAHENLIMKKGADQLMYVSDSHEKKALEKVQGGIWWMLGLGFVLGAIGLFVLLTTFGV
ncbi:MAG: GIDE domain-containing protein [Candidatus Micrarchaeota archaeon]